MRKEQERKKKENPDRVSAGKNYEDILHLSRPVSKKHPPMPMLNRAAQFAPFAALTGYEDALEETARRREAEEEGQ